MKQNETNLGEKGEKGETKFHCVLCDYTCSIKFSYDRHILTAKHVKRSQNETNETNETKKEKKREKGENNKNAIICDCGSIYHSRTTLWRHKKICNEIKKSNATREIFFEENADQIEASLIKAFDTIEVSKIVMKAKSGKAPGIDGLVVDTMKNDASILILTSLFNACLRCRKMPSVWARGVINPIPKSAANDPRVPLNYRGISLLPVTSKLYTAAISNRLSQFLEKNKLLADEQNGFRPERSCLDHIFTLQNL